VSTRIVSVRVAANLPAAMTEAGDDIIVAPPRRSG
jgi:hypothetical protein